MRDPGDTDAQSYATGPLGTNRNADGWDDPRDSDQFADQCLWCHQVIDAYSAYDRAKQHIPACPRAVETLGRQPCADCDAIGTHYSWCPRSGVSR